MRKIITILGIILTIITLLISGSAVAAMVWIVDVADSSQCTNPLEARYEPDNVHATLGQNPDKKGWIVLDFGSGHEIPDSTDFRVHANSNSSEEYNVRVSTSSGPNTGTYVGTDEDTSAHVFTTPSSGGPFRYVIIEFETGGITPIDPIYGPEIDAVGWNTT